MEKEMVLLSRAFIRKRVISLATSASVAATSFALAQDPAKTHHVRGGRQYAPDQQEHSEAQPFLSASAAAMRKMMADMAIKPTTEYGRDEQLHRLAQRIRATRPREITVMQNAVSDGRSSSAQSLEQPHTAFPQLDSIDGSAARGAMGMSR
jgi:hypothetical protein